MEKVCQSCGMPLNPEVLGTNKDGSKSEEYCHYCYKDGEFTDGCNTVEEKIAKNVSIAMKMGMSEDNAKSLANSVLPTLKRWKK